MRQYDSIREIKGIGPKAEEQFHKIKINTVGDLLQHFPRTYDWFRPIQPVASVSEGSMVAVEGVLSSRPKLKSFHHMKMVSAMLNDGSGQIPIAWYNMPFLMKQLRLGKSYILRGKVCRKNNVLVLEQPKFYSKTEYHALVDRLQPVYPLTSGLTNRLVQKSVKEALRQIEDLDEFLPAEIRRRQKLITYQKAVRQMHFPRNEMEYREARKRLVFDELFLYGLALCHLKKQGHRESYYVFSEKQEAIRFQEALPFRLTKSQQKVYDEIKQDLYGGTCMNRLLQGDVGSGKTIVAVLALFLAVKNGFQGAFMVPTEVLAMQHYNRAREWLEPYQVRVGLLTGSLPAGEKKRMQEKICTGEVDLVIGTHAIIQDRVEFFNLALVITDEQHRFGVRQREHLFKKGREPHVLAMSATPIPRSLALILFGDMDLSVMDTLPCNRLPVKNCVVGTNYRPAAYKHMVQEIEAGRQAYIICPAIEESGDGRLENVTMYAEELRESLGDKIRIDVLHGRMKPAKKNEIMGKFEQGETDILISTTVVEVGIDVPNATTIMIENAEQFGLAQLHQLRGRVGRGDAQSYCIFMAGVERQEAIDRLQILAESNDGFYIASEDLKMRGQGDLFGVAQSGNPLFELADLYEDAPLLTSAHEEALKIGTSDAWLLFHKNERWKGKMEQYMGMIMI